MRTGESRRPYTALFLILFLVVALAYCVLSLVLRPRGSPASEAQR